MEVVLGDLDGLGVARYLTVGGLVSSSLVLLLGRLWGEGEVD